MQLLGLDMVLHERHVLCKLPNYQMIQVYNVLINFYNLIGELTNKTRLAKLHYIMQSLQITQSVSLGFFKVLQNLITNMVPKLKRQILIFVTLFEDLTL